MKKVSPITCIVTGTCLMVYSSIALAKPSVGIVSFEYLFTTLIGVTVLLIGAYFKGVKDTLAEDIKENKDEINSLDAYINENHVTKKELSYVIREEMRPLQNDLQSIKNLLKIRS